MTFLPFPHASFSGCKRSQRFSCDEMGMEAKNDVFNPIFCSLLSDAPQLSHASFTFQTFLSCPRQVPSPFQLRPHLRTSRSTSLPSPSSSGLPSTHIGNNKPRPFGHRLLGPIPLNLLMDPSLPKLCLLLAVQRTPSQPFPWLHSLTRYTQGQTSPYPEGSRPSKKPVPRPGPYH